ncbi:MAG: L,D-transpeptidase [Acidimicrobiia bacterium]|nr:L,D-transpeptidase [Acidimicrobiia bacterium]
MAARARSILIAAVAVAALVTALAPADVGRPAALPRLQPLAAGPFAVHAFGDAPALGAPAALPDGRRLVDVASTPTGGGYWLAGSDGGVLTYGDATFHGSLGGSPLNQPIVAMAASPTGDGYWLVAADGGVFAFGDAAFHGSLGGSSLNQPIVAMAASPTGDGYWLVAADGGVFAFGDATFHGSMGGVTLDRAVVQVAATSTGGGYWLVAADGGVFAFGDATFHGSLGGWPLPHPVVALVPTSSGEGYWMATTDGGVMTFGDAAFHGSAPGSSQPVAAMAAMPGGEGYWLLTGPPPVTPRIRALTAPPVPAGSGSGRRIVYSNSAQRAWLVEGDGVLYDSFLVSGRRGYPPPGTYRVWLRMRFGRSGSLSLPYFVGFAHGATTSVGFHGIPLRPDGSPIQTDAELGQFRSHGCVRVSQSDAELIWNWAPLGTTVVLVP